MPFSQGNNHSSADLPGSIKAAILSVAGTTVSVIVAVVLSRLRVILSFALIALHPFLGKIGDNDSST